MSIESVMPSSRLILGRPLLLPSICPRIRVFSNEPPLRIKWPKYWSFSFHISPSNEHPGLILAWTGLISLQSKGLSKSSLTPQFKPSILQCSAFFTVQLSHPYMTTAKTVALTRRTLVGNFGKLSSGHRTGKGQFSFQSRRKQCQRMLKLLHNYTHLTR